MAIVLAIALLLGCGGDDDDAEPPASAEAAATSTEAPALPEDEITAQGAKRLEFSDLLEAQLTSAEEPDWLVSGFGSVWAKLGSGDVMRVDPATGKLVSEIGEGKPGQRPPGGHLCQGLGASDEAIWLCQEVGSVARIDPKTNQVTATVKLDNLPDQGRLVSAAGHIWVLTNSGATLTGIDTETNKAGPEIDLGGRRCADLATDGSTIFAMCPLEDRLLTVDPEAGQITDNLRAGRSGQRRCRRGPLGGLRGRCGSDCPR